MSEEHFLMRIALKQSHWEQAKGHLRALVALDGCMISPNRHEPGTKFPFQITSDAVEKFITEFEGEGHNQ